MWDKSCHVFFLLKKPRTARPEATNHVYIEILPVQHVLLVLQGLQSQPVRELGGNPFHWPINVNSSHRCMVCIHEELLGPLDVSLAKETVKREDRETLVHLLS